MEFNEIKELIGDYQEFFSYLHSELRKLSIEISDMPLSHLNYRVETNQHYEELRDKLKSFCSEFIETEYNGRPVSILVLRNPLILAKGYEVSTIELPAPRPVHTYPTGLEHLGIVLGDELPQFKEKHRESITSIKDRSPYDMPACITFNGKTAKFYQHSLRTIVEMQGYRFEQL